MKYIYRYYIYTYIIYIYRYVYIIYIYTYVYIIYIYIKLIHWFNLIKGISERPDFTQKLIKY